MEKILKEISKKAILLNDFEFSKEQIKAKWLGNPPATDKAIELTEIRLNVSFPNDYIEFLKITNGFQNTHFTSSTLLPVESIGYFKEFDEDLIEVWCEPEETDDEVLRENRKCLERSILIGGSEEEQQVLLIPPILKKDKWQYWEFALWIPGEQAHKSFTDYLKSVLDFLKSETKGLKKPQPQVVIDYSLRDAVYAFDWQKVFNISRRFILKNKSFGYYNGDSDLFALLLLSAFKTKRQNDFLQLMEDIEQKIENGSIKNDFLLQKHKVAARENIAFLADIQELHRFKPQLNPRGLDDIEKQIEEHRKDLLKPKNSVEKIDYQLFFLFEFGNALAFIELFEVHKAYLFYTNYLKAGMVYAYLKKYEKAKESLMQYKKIAFEFRPFEPFLNETLLAILEDDKL